MEELNMGTTGSNNCDVQIIKELSNINKNLQSINVTLDKLEKIFGVYAGAYPVNKINKIADEVYLLNRKGSER